MTQKNILLVDDDEDLLESTSYILQELGCQIHSAKDGLEAVKSYKENNPCLVFMDIKMPNMNGFEAFRKIKEFDKNARVILTSGFEGFSDELDKAREEGLLDFQNKPIAHQTYKELITKYD